MFCPTCGTSVADEYKVCPNCGTPLNEQPAQQSAPEYQQPYYENQQYAQPQQFNNYQQPMYNADPAFCAPPRKVSFIEAIKLFFVNYVKFDGRSTVEEYWFVFLFSIVVGTALGFIPSVGTILSSIFSAATLIPSIALSVRRLHDTGKSWTYLFVAFIPIAGIFMLIFRFAKKSDGDNQWGPVPR